MCDLCVLTGMVVCITLAQIYVDKMKADAIDDAIQNRRQNMQEFVKDWFMNRCDHQATVQTYSSIQLRTFFS